MNWGSFTIDVNGKPATFEEDDLGGDAYRMSVFWGQVLAEAEAEQLRVDAEYRGWRADLTLEILKKDSKLSEWKVRAKIESDPLFRTYKEGAALALRNMILARAVHEACRARAACGSVPG